MVRMLSSQTVCLHVTCVLFVLSSCLTVELVVVSQREGRKEGELEGGSEAGGEGGRSM